MHETKSMPHVMIFHHINGCSRRYYVPHSHFALPDPVHAYTFGWPSKCSSHSGEQVPQLARSLEKLQGVKKGSISTEGIHIEVVHTKPSSWFGVGPQATAAILREAYPHQSTVMLSVFIVDPDSKKAEPSELVCGRVQIQRTNTKDIALIENHISTAML